METVATLEAAAELAREHDEIDRLATHVSTLSEGPARREMVLEACHRYAAHAQVEARHLMPAVCHYLPDGSRAAAEEAERHQAMVRTIATFERLCGRRAEPGADPDGPPDPDSFDELDELDIVVGQLVAGIQAHVERQDTQLLPALNRVCPLTESRRLGARLHEALSAASRSAYGDADPQPRHHGIAALFHFLARALSPHAGEPAGTS